jgi:Protein of unknown function (DUF3800)
MFSRQPLEQEEPLFGLPIPVQAEEDQIVMFLIFGDESGKLHQSDYTSFCGYVAHVSTWNTLSGMWNACRLRWQVPPIHMARVMHPDRKDDQWKRIKEEWGESWEAKRDVMLGEFATLVKGSGIICVGGIVDAAYFRKVADSDPSFKAIFKDPIYMSFHSLLMRGIDKTEVVDTHASIGIVIDDDEEFAMAVYQQLNNFRKELDPQLRKRYDEPTREKMKRVKDRVHAITFADDASHPGLQAADMIAYETRKMMVERITTPDATSELYEQLTFFRTNQPKFYRPVDIDALQAGLKEAIANGAITI